MCFFMYDLYIVIDVNAVLSVKWHIYRKSDVRFYNYTYMTFYQEMLACKLLFHVLVKMAIIPENL